MYAIVRTLEIAKSCYFTCYSPANPFQFVAFQLAKHMSKSCVQTFPFIALISSMYYYRRMNTPTAIYQVNILYTPCPYPGYGLALLSADQSNIFHAL
jgi:hypothetical protein